MVSGWRGSALGMLVFLLASCVESDERAVIGLDGRAWFTFHQRLPRAAVTALGGEQRLRLLLQQVVETDPGVLRGASACWLDESNCHIALSGEVSRWWRLPRLLQKWDGEPRLPAPVRGLIGTMSWRIQGWHVELTRTVDWRAPLAWSRFSPELPTSVSPIRYEWHLPLPMASNATRVEQGGCCHVWEFGLKQASQAPLALSLRISLLAIVGVPLMIGAVAIWFWRWCRKRFRNKANTRANER